jgi:uncharacterized protein (TIGR02118 family)
MFCASVLYPVEAEDFDFDYFATRHAPMFARLLGDNCVRYEVHRGLATPGAPPPPFLAAAYFWVGSAERFGANARGPWRRDLLRHPEVQPNPADARMGRGLPVAQPRQDLPVRVVDRKLPIL